MHHRIIKLLTGFLILGNGGIAYALLVLGLEGRRQSIKNDVDPTQVLRLSWLSVTKSSVVEMVMGLFLTLFYYSIFISDVIKHYTLCFILSRKGYTPREYVHFLNYAAERIFMYKVGGGYEFIHRLLLEHFAAIGEAKEKP